VLEKNGENYLDLYLEKRESITWNEGGEKYAKYIKKKAS
jgi:hypothetical protein